MWVVVAVSVIATVLIVLLAVNATAGSRKVEHPLASVYGAEDPQFARDMDGLLAPGLKHGNRVEAFQNGSRIFPAMLEAIRGAARSINFETYITGRAGSDASSRRRSPTRRRQASPSTC
jgi:cardiolipin synthase A/B